MACVAIGRTDDQTGAAGSASFSQVPTTETSLKPAMNVGMYPWRS